MSGDTLLDKLWERHVVESTQGEGDVLYVDLHLVHEVTSPQAFAMLDERELPVRRPDRTVATVDHIVPTTGTAASEGVNGAEAMVTTLNGNAEEGGIELWGPGHGKRGIVHVTAPEHGLVQPGTSIVCGDSHTSTLGAFGALAFGIGTTEIAHVLATQTLVKSKPAPLEVRLEGELSPGVTAKDAALALIARIGADGARGHAIEYTGPGARALTMEQRMTVCNMAIEAGARMGLVPPDETTRAYLEERGSGPEALDVGPSESLNPDPDAEYADSITLDVAELAPMVTYGTTPAMAVPVDQPVLTADEAPDHVGPRAHADALAYMDLESGQPMSEVPVDVVFLGSCTNARLSDLRAAAGILADRQVHSDVEMLVVPGSERVKRRAEAEGLDEVFQAAGAQWRKPGCSMCIAMNGDRLDPGQLAVSTSNRNYPGRQGPEGRTVLASPVTAAGSAIQGHVADPRPLVEGRMS